MRDITVGILGVGRIGKLQRILMVGPRYGAIAPSGDVAYSECFQCLDCVTIHDDESQCVPLILDAKKKQRRAVPKNHPNAVPAE